MSELWFSGKLGMRSRHLHRSDSGLSDNHVHNSRAPHHHHHHHHNRYHRLGTMQHKLGPDRDLSAAGISADNEHVNLLARHRHEKVVISGDHDHVRVGRSPHHGHHHDEHKKVVVSGDHDHVRVGRSPRSHHHHDHHYDHHGGHAKVVVSGDHDHVRVDRSTDGHHDDEKVTTSRDNGRVHFQRSVFIAGEQGHSYVVPRVAKRSAPQEPFTLGKRADGLDGVPGRIDIMVCGIVIER